MPRLLPVGAALAAAVTLSLTAASADAATKTPFLLGASGFGTQVAGGQIPVGSGTTGKALIGCTNRAGISRVDTTDSVAVPGGLGQLQGVSSHAYTVKRGGMVSSWSKHSIQKVVLAQSSVGELDLTALHSVAHAWHNAKGYHSTASTTLGGIAFTVAGQTQKFPIPSPGQSVTIPGLGTVSLGASTASHAAHQATAEVAGVQVHLAASDSTVTIAHAQARITDRTLNGVFHGSASGVQAKAVQNYVGVDPVPALHMPCQGTGGKVFSKAPAAVPAVPSALDVTGLGAHNRGRQTARGATGFEQGSVNHIDLGGQLVVDGLVGKVNVTWNKAKHRYVVNSKGTRAGSIKLAGQSYSLPALDGASIPNVAKFQTDVFHRGTRGGTVTALRITLLDGSGAVINLGNAALRIQPFGK